ncbi:MAG: lysylphosphatidylglycerol synthase domain-containing protein [Anaerolineae bacterium]
MKVPAWLRTVSGIVLLLVVVGFFVGHARQTACRVQQAWQPVSWLYIVLSLGMLVACLVAMAFMWYGLLRTLNGTLPALTAVRFYGLSLLPRYVPGMVWGYAGRTILCERAGVPRRVALSSIAAEVGLIVGSGAIVTTLKPLGQAWIALLALPGVILLLGILSLSLVHRRDWGSALRRVATWYGWILAYVGFWLLYSLSTWLVVMSVAPEAGLSSLPDVMVSTTLAWMGGFIVVFVPGGLGVREGLLSLTLTPTLGREIGIFVPLMARLIGLASEAAFFATCTFLPGDGRGIAGAQETA